MSASADVRIVAIPPVFLAEFLRLAARHLERGARVSALDPFELAEDLRSNRAALWCVFVRDSLDGACFSSVHEDETGRTVHVYGLGGVGVHEWGRKLSDTMADHAAKNQCRAVRFHGRKAWARVLSDYRVVGSENGASIYERAIA